MWVCVSDIFVVVVRAIVAQRADPTCYDSRTIRSLIFLKVLTPSQEKASLCCMAGSPGNVVWVVSLGQWPAELEGAALC